MTLREFPEPPKEPVESVAIYWPGMDLKIYASGTAKTPPHRFAFTKSGLENISARLAAAKDQITLSYAMREKGTEATRGARGKSVKVESAGGNGA